MTIEGIAAEYEAAPTVERRAAEMWRLYVEREIEPRARHIRTQLTVLETREEDPYPDSAAQSEDILSGRFLVSSANCDHPAWTPDENISFRIVHDVLGHHQLRAAFDRTGEIAVFRWQLSWTPIYFKPILFTESLGQLSILWLTGAFGEQKVFIPERFK